MEAGCAPYKQLYPSWKGPFELTATKSVAMMLQVLDNVGPEDSGNVLSHLVSTGLWGIPKSGADLVLGQ